MKLKLPEQENKKTLTFLLFLTAGFSIYTYTYSIVFIFAVFVLFLLTHDAWEDIRSQILALKLNPFSNIKNSKTLKVVKILDIIIFLFILAIFFSYTFGGFGLDIMGISIFQINNLHKPVFQLFILLIARYLIYRKDLKDKLHNIKRFKNSFSSENKSLIIIALGGFIVGLLPRILSILSGQVSRGGEGFDLDFSPIKLTSHFWHLFVNSFPELLGLREYIHKLITNDTSTPYSIAMSVLSLVILSLFLAAIISFCSSNVKIIKSIFTIKSIPYNPASLLIIFFITVCTANIISQTGPIYPRYIYPLYMVLIIWVSLYLKKIRGKSIVVFIFLLTIWSGFYLTSHYEKMTDLSFVNVTSKNLEINKRKEPLLDIIKFCRSKNVDVAYGDFLFVYKANFLGNNSPFFIEYLTKPKYYGSNYFLTKAKSSRKKNNFAVVVHQDFVNEIYLKYLSENELKFYSEPFGMYTVYSDFEGPLEKIALLQTLMDNHYDY